MKKIPVPLLLAMAGAVASGAASAAVRTNLLGDPGNPQQAERTIVITPKTRYVNVTEGNVVRFVANDVAFVWNFDSPGIDSFALNRVAPAGMLDLTVIAFIAPDVGVL